MRITKLDIDHFDNITMETGVLCIVRPFRAKIFRAQGLPPGRHDNQELEQVLNTLCFKKREGVWYFKLPDEEAIGEMCRILDEMAVPHVILEPDITALN